MAWLYLAFSVCFVVTILPWLIIPFIGDKFITSYIKALLMTLGYVIVVAVVLFAVLRIRKYSKLLVENRIFANECLMTWQLGLLIAAVLTKVTMSLIYYRLMQVDDTSSATKHEERLYLGYLVPYYCIGFINMSVIATMLLMFLKHSTDLSGDKKNEIARRFLLVFVNNDDLSQINTERIRQYQEAE